MTNSHEKVWKEIWRGTKDLVKTVLIAGFVLLLCAGAIALILSISI